MRCLGRIGSRIARIEIVGAVDDEIEAGEVPRGRIEAEPLLKSDDAYMGFSRAIASAALCVFISPIVPVS